MLLNFTAVLVILRCCQILSPLSCMQDSAPRLKQPLTTRDFYTCVVFGILFSFLPIGVAVSFKTNPELEKRLEFQIVLWARSTLICLPRTTLSMIVLAVDLPGPFPIGQVSFKSYLPRKKIYLSWTTRRVLPPGSLSVTRQSGYTVEPNFTNPHLIQTPHYYGQFALSLGNKSPYIFSKFNPLNTDTPLTL